jgi:CubicO group peptidase (beta-lactamase class C family)
VRRSLNLISLTTFTLALFSLFAISGNALAQDKAKKIDELMSLHHGYGQFNGTVLVAESGKVIYKKGFGLANMEWDIPNHPDTKFRLGSITKQFTSMLIMQLVEQGKIKLDAKLSDYLPDYRKDTGDKVTIHHLLTHTSGIPSYTGLPRFFQDVSRTHYSVDEFVKKYCSGDLQFEPGSKFSYNNSGYFLLGAIIEKVTGKPYEQVLKERIFDPLGMKDTGYDHHDSILNKRASGYERTPAGIINAPYLDMSLPYAAGSMYSTVEDLYLWDQALYTNKLLPASYKEIMFKPFLNEYAYGWAVVKLPLGDSKETASALSHGGGINGFNTVIVRLIDNKHLIVLLNNTGGAKLDQMSSAIAAILYDKPYSLPKKSIAELLVKTISDRGIEQAVRQYRELKAKQAGAYDYSEPELNMLGYRLLSMNKVKEAIEIFKLNIEAYPQSSNVYDSLGEAYMVNGDKELAIKNYQRSLELNPQNTNAVEMLKKLDRK